MPKLLKEFETEETIGFFVTFLSLVAFQLGVPGPYAPWLHLWDRLLLLKPVYHFVIMRYYKNKRYCCCFFYFNLVRLLIKLFL